MLPIRQFSPLPSLLVYQRVESQAGWWATPDKVSARQSALRRFNASPRSERIWRTTIRWCVHVFVRLAIAATCTSSAAAREAQVERSQITRAFSSEVETGSHQENASKQESRGPLRFYRSGNGSSGAQRNHSFGEQISGKSHVHFI
jgi:hypothetical protein